MGNYAIPENPKFDLKVRRLEPTDRAHADVFNAIFQRILENEAYLFVKQEGSGIVVRDIVVPTDGWNTGTEEVAEGMLYIDIPQEDITEDMIPLLTILPMYTDIAGNCGMSTTARTVCGGLRLYTKKVPKSEIQASLTLLLASNGAAAGDGGSGEDYALPVATATRLGGVKIGNGLSVSSDGTLSIDGDTLIEEVAAADGDVQEALNEIYGVGDTDG